MTGIEKITEKIIAEARAEANDIVERAREKSLGIARDYAAKADAIVAELDEAAKREADGIISRARSTIEVDRRNAMLAEKSKIIDETFREAYDSIRNLDDDKYVEFLVMLAGSALSEQIESEKVGEELYGKDEDAAEIEKYEIILCKKDREKYDEALILGLRRSVIGKVPPEVIEKVVISSEDANMGGGLILRYGDIESNCSLELIFDRIRAKLEGEVSHILFGA